MGWFKNLFSKKEGNTSEAMDVETVENTNTISGAERIAKIVTEGLETENYAGMNEQLSVFGHTNEEKDKYVYKHPGVIGRYCVSVLSVVISLIFVYYLLIGLGTACFASVTELVYLGVLFVGVSGIVLVVNIILILKTRSSIRFKKRYEVYADLLGYRHYVLVEDIVMCAKQKEALVVKDLKRAIKCKLIPQGHFSSENLVIMLSNTAYEQYLENAADYDWHLKKMMEERHEVEQKTESLNQMIETGEQYLENMHRYGSLVKDKSVSKKIKRMERTVFMNLHEIKVNPDKAQSLMECLKCYLSATEKILEAYVTLDANKTAGTNLKKIRKEIEKAISSMVIAYEGIFEEVYEEYEVDISAIVRR